MTRLRGNPFLAALMFLACLWIGRMSCIADTASPAFDNANKLYEQGKFNEAADAFEKLVQTGKVSEALYFNWGNALFKAGKIGRAIVAYQHAQEMAPRDPDVRANLQFARNQVQGPTLLPDKLARWFAKLNLNEWTWLAMVSVWLLLLLLTLRQWRTDLRTPLRPYTLWTSWACAILCACFGAAFYLERVNQRAIVVTQELTGHQAPLDESPMAFTLHDGAELEVLDQKDQWLQVKIDARRIGWVHRDNTLLLHQGS